MILASIAFKSSLIPAFLAIFKTVSGLSPEIILILTPWLLKYSKVSLASFLISSSIKTKPITSKLVGVLLNCSLFLQTTKIR